MKKEEIKKLLDFDSLSAAEKITGMSYKESEETGLLGLGLQMVHSQRMAELMDQTDDTKFSETTSEYLRKVKTIGFEIVYQEDFTTDDIRSRTNYTSSGHFATLYLDFSTMETKPYQVERPKWNYKNDVFEEYQVLVTKWSNDDHQYRKDNNLRAVWSGDHDCREGIKNQIGLMCENGFFLEKWIDEQFIWLTHHGDKTTNNCKARFDKLPDHVKSQILVRF